MARHRQALQPLTEMNVTNLLDTAFILLMAFMIVAPTIKHGLELDLPTVGGTQIEDQKKTINVVIQPAAEPGGLERIFIEERRLTVEELQAELIEQKRLFPELDIIMEIDKAVPWDTAARALGAVKAAEIQDVGFITMPPNEETR